MATTADFRNGMVLSIDGELWTLTYFQHVKPGKGGAFVRTKLKHVLSGRVVDRTYRSGEKVEDVRLERRPVQYSYTDGDEPGVAMNLFRLVESMGCKPVLMTTLPNRLLRQRCGRE